MTNNNKNENIEMVNYAVLRFTLSCALRTAHFLGKDIEGQCDELIKALKEQEIIKGIDYGNPSRNS